MRKKHYTCYIANHRGGLDDCLRTERFIPYQTFCKLVKCGLYQYYGFDSRINCHRYLIVNMVYNFNMPTWLHYYGKKPICNK